jgi:hypothetical protein
LDRSYRVGLDKVTSDAGLDADDGDVVGHEIVHVASDA